MDNLDWKDWKKCEGAFLVISEARVTLYQVYLHPAFQYHRFILTVLELFTSPSHSETEAKHNMYLQRKKRSAPVEGHWFLNLGKWAMLPHSQAEFPMATESRKAGDQFNS